MSNLYTIEIAKKLHDEFYNEFFDHINEQIREFWMDHKGKRNRTLEEACMEVVSATEGYTIRAIFDEEAELDADEYQMMIMDLVDEVGRKMLTKMAGEW